MTNVLHSILRVGTGGVSCTCKECVHILVKEVYESPYTTDNLIVDTDLHDRLESGLAPISPPEYFQKDSYVQYVSICITCFDDQTLTRTHICTQVAQAVALRNSTIYPGHTGRRKSSYLREAQSDRPRCDRKKEI